MALGKALFWKLCTDSKALKDRNRLVTRTTESSKPKQAQFLHCLLESILAQQLHLHTHLGNGSTIVQREEEKTRGVSI